MTRQPIIGDALFVAAVRGQRYALLLPRGDVAAAVEEAREALRRSLTGFDVVSPAPHLTLASFAAGSELREVQAAVDRWARATAPLSLAIEGIGTVGPPHQVVYVALRKNAPLERAYARLRRETSLRGLRPVSGEAGDYSAERWLPHLTLAYCDRLSPDQWERARMVASSLEIADASCLVPVADVVAYDDEGEHEIGSYPLGVGRRYN